MTTRLQQLAILNSGRANLLTGTTPETAIDVFAKRFGSVGQSSFRNRTHQIESAAWAIIFVAGNYICWTRLETKPAVDAGQKLLLFFGNGRSDGLDSIRLQDCLLLFSCGL